MTECAAADVRDRLPDLLLGTLEAAEAAEAAEVRAHLAACTSCREEFSLLEAAREALVAQTPAVDVDRIVAALPRPRVARPDVGAVSRKAVPSRGLSLPPSVRSPGRSWRRRSALGALAAALVLGAVGVWSAGGRDAGSLPRGDTLAAAGQVDAERTAAPRAGLSFAGGVSDLPDEALVSLLADLEALEPAPAAEPELVDWTFGDVEGD